MLPLIGFLAFAAIMLGGLFALKYSDKLHLILGFSAGTVIGVAFFDLLPEAVELGENYYEIDLIAGMMALGFVIFMLLDRLTLFHGHSHDEGEQEHKTRGTIGAASLSLHSMLDGMAIGLAFKVSPSIGAIVALAVLAHGFSDGINTVNMILKNKGSKRQALKWVATDALAPVIGLLLTLFFTLPDNILGLLLALFGGFFFYIGASDLLPESYHRHPTRWTTLATLIGMGTIYLAVRVVHI